MFLDNTMIIHLKELKAPNQEYLSQICAILHLHKLVEWYPNI